MWADILLVTTFSPHTEQCESALGHCLTHWVSAVVPDSCRIWWEVERRASVVAQDLWGSNALHEPDSMDRQTDGQTDRRTDRKTIMRHNETYRQRPTKRDRQQTDRQTERQTDR